jgi:hypothetical protein
MSYISINENFLNESSCESYLTFCKNTNKWDDLLTTDSWNQRIIYENNFPDFETKWKDYLLLVKDKIKKDFDIKEELYPDYIGLVRWKIGDVQNPHADGENIAEAHPFPWRNFGCVYYLNDDYAGGEIYFPNQKIELKPKPNTLIFFPGTLEFLHGVKPITSGVRYTLSSFWTYDKQQSMLR